MEILRSLQNSPHPVNFKPAEVHLPLGLLSLLQPLHEKFTPWQMRLAQYRRSRRLAAHELKRFPDYNDMRPMGAERSDDAVPDQEPIELPSYLRDQRNQITGPASDAKMVVGMANAESPGLMWDLEDSMVNRWEKSQAGFSNIVHGLHGELPGIDPEKFKKTVPFVRVRGLHMSQWGVLDGAVSASLFDTVALVHMLDLDRLPHRTLHLYIPKSESAAEALWWAAMFRDVCKAKGWPEDAIKCMALVESHPLAFEMDKFIYVLRKNIVGLNIGRWDYMANQTDYMRTNPKWVLPDRDTIPVDAPFFNNVRDMMIEACHAQGILAIGGMTAIFPDKMDAELDAAAAKAVEEDKKYESKQGCDGAWSGHPKQTTIAVAQFPVPNQLQVRKPWAHRLDLRPAPPKDLPVSEAGTRAAIRTAILYRVGVLNGLGAVMIRGTDGRNRMEDLATDRICRVQIAQRLALGIHSEDEVVKMFDQEKAKLVSSLPKENILEAYERLIDATRHTMTMIFRNDHDPA
ncbi:hypothetical protein HY633_04965 [Candidatus Uhrbacteria bacterium]|nr:hypothetical protein [Candidatus Uhrbacteria bacterium]